MRSLSGIFGVKYNKERTPGRNHDEVWMRDLIGFAAHCVDLVRCERDGSIEFANRLDNHEEENNPAKFTIKL
jgi:hypothetical protein